MKNLPQNARVVTAQIKAQNHISSYPSDNEDILVIYTSTTLFLCQITFCNKDSGNLDTRSLQQMHALRVYWQVRMHKFCEQLLSINTDPCPGQRLPSARIAEHACDCTPGVFSIAHPCRRSVSIAPALIYLFLLCIYFKAQKTRASNL